jgi:hypothetical protein
MLSALQMDGRLLLGLPMTALVGFMGSCEWQPDGRGRVLCTTPASTNQRRAGKLGPVAWRPLGNRRFAFLLVHILSHRRSNCENKGAGGDKGGRAVSRQGKGDALFPRCGIKKHFRTRN